MHITWPKTDGVRLWVTMREWLNYMVYSPDDVGDGIIILLGLLITSLGGANVNFIYPFVVL